MILSGCRSLEDPRKSLADWPEVDEFMSDTGERMSRDKALQYSPVWRAVDLASSTVAKVPLIIYQRHDSGKDPAKDHPAYGLLRYQPNSEASIFDAMKAAMVRVLLEPGNAYFYIDRVNSEPVGLYLLDSFAVTPVRKDGELWYVYTPNGQMSNRIPASDILHIRGMSFDGLAGMSVLKYARHSIGMGSAAQKYSNKYFANNAEPRMVLQYPEWMKPEQAKQIIDSWKKMHSGLNNSHKAAILQGGMTANRISLSAQDSQLIESLEWSVRDVANWFGVPAHKLGDSSKVAYNSLEQENQSMLDDTVDPWLVRIELECRRKLLTERQKETDSHVIQYARKALVRANLQARADYYSKALSGHPWETVNEVRNDEGMNSKEGFDDIKPPTNNFSREQRTAELAAARRVLSETVERMQNRVGIQVTKAGKRSDASHAEVLQAVMDEQRDSVAEALTAPAETVAILEGRETKDVIAECFSEIRAKYEVR